MTADDVTTNELVRWLERVDSRLGGLEQLIAERTVPRDLYDAHRQAMQGDIDDVKRLSWWALGLVVTLVIGTLFAWAASL